MCNFNDSQNKNVRKITREMKLEILKSLPSQTNPTKEEQEIFNSLDLETLIAKTKNKEGPSFIEKLHSNREFNNPENLQKIINHYKIDERETNFPIEMYDPHNVIQCPDDCIEGIIRKQNELIDLINSKNKHKNKIKIIK